MVRALLILMAVVNISFGYSQDVSKFGIDVGTYVAIDSSSPIGYTVDSKIATAKILGLTGGSVKLKVTNKVNEMLFVSYNDSYFVVGGSTFAVIPKNTYVKDINYEVKDDKIAPSTNFEVTLLTPEHNDFFNPIFSNGRAHKMYKEKGHGVSESLVLVVKDNDGNKIEHKFAFDVTPVKMVSDYKKSTKKKSKI